MQGGWRAYPYIVCPHVGVVVDEVPRVLIRLVLAFNAYPGIVGRQIAVGRHFARIAGLGVDGNVFELCPRVPIRERAFSARGRMVCADGQCGQRQQNNQPAEMPFPVFHRSIPTKKTDPQPGCGRGSVLNYTYTF